ncbi:MAG: thiamine phosphate synthase [Xanthobacteraceae bacterium]
MTLPAPPLLLITDRSQARENILDIAVAALAAGCRWISLREKDLPEADQTALLGELLQRARPYNARVTLHGDPTTALHAKAHGVHLSAGNDAATARRILGKDALVGLSVHSAAEARKVDPAPLDYVIAGPVFETASKPGYGPALRPEGLAVIVKASRVPVIAIGGVTLQTISDCLAAGATGVAVMGGVMRAADPGKEIEKMLAA